MTSYDDRRQLLSDELYPHLVEVVHELFPAYASGPSSGLFNSKQLPITGMDSLDEMRQAYSFDLTRADGESRYISIVLQPTQSGGIAVSVLTDPRAPRHVIEIEDDDVGQTIPHLKALIDETLEELAAA